MCGIVGFFNNSSPPDDQVALINAMLAKISHRGPDELGIYFDNKIGIGSTRLSIIDPVNGKQPFHDKSGRYWLCFNGLIYNYIELRQELTAKGYQFETKSDTEVLLASWITWGAAVLEKLNGGFAFAIYDRVEGSLTLVRDRFGKRPLYYTNAEDGTFIFGSEIKSFLPYKYFSPALDLEMLTEIFTFWTPTPDGSAFKGVKQVPPGSMVSIGPEMELKLKCLTRAELEEMPYEGSLEEALFATRNSITESVRIRLRGDVPVGVYLSGGMDSTLMTKVVQELSGNQVHTFSVEFDDPTFDESDMQQVVSSRIGTDHTAIRINDTDITANFQSALWHAEVPMFSTAIVPMWLMSKQVQEKGFKAVITGEGADEVFVGYDIFKETLIRSLWEKDLGKNRKHELLQSIYQYLNHFTNNNIRALTAFFDRFSSKTKDVLFSHQIRFHNSTLSRRLLNSDYNAEQRLRAIAEADPAFTNLDTVKKAQCLEILTLLSGYLLSSQGDRMAFSHGVENRCPFLDPSLFSLAAKFPLEFKLKNYVSGKYVVREAFKDFLPARVESIPKKPYRSPGAAAFFGKGCPEYLNDAISLSELKKIDFLNHELASRLVAKVSRVGRGEISYAENQAFLLLLSTKLLHLMFVERKDVPATRYFPKVVKMFDGRGKAVLDLIK